MKRGNLCSRRTLVWCWTAKLAAAAVVVMGRQFLIGPETAVATEEEEAKVSGFTATSTPKPKVTQRDDAEKPPAENWLVIPVTTELQRIRAGRDARAYVLVNGEAFRQNRVTLDTRALNLDALRKQLEPYADPDKATVCFRVLTTPMKTFHMVVEGRTKGFKEGLPGETVKRDYVTPVIRYALMGFGKTAGFRDARIDWYGRGRGWPESWNPLVAHWKKGLAQDAGRDESGIGNERFKVYRVQTTLSRFLYQNADCVLHVEVEGGIGSKDLKAIEEAVDKLNLKKRQWLFFHLPESLQGLFFRQTFWKERLGFERYISGSGYHQLGLVQ